MHSTVNFFTSHSRKAMKGKASRWQAMSPIVPVPNAFQSRQ